jgi:hypothetical protein
VILRSTFRHPSVASFEDAVGTTVKLRRSVRGAIGTYFFLDQLLLDL